MGAIPKDQPALPADLSIAGIIRENFGSRTSPPPAHPFLKIRKKRAIGLVAQLVRARA
jgi:hypothetical protein